MTKSVLFEINDGVGVITLNRPERLNAFDAELAEAWALTTAEAVQRDDVQAILVCGEGRAFCAGGDVQAMAQMGDERGATMLTLARRINDGMRNLVTASKPVVVAAQGTTAGGGLGVLLSCDYAIIGESAKVGSLYAAMGLTPDLSVTALLARAVGERRALQLCLQERMLNASEALDWGLAAEVVADDQVLARAEAVARHWVQNAGWAYGQAKRLLRKAAWSSFDEQLEDEAQTIAAAAVTAQADARINHFSVKK